MTPIAIAVSVVIPLEWNLCRPLCATRRPVVVVARRIVSVTETGGLFYGTKRPLWGRKIEGYFRMCISMRIEFVRGSIKRATRENGSVVFSGGRR